MPVRKQGEAHRALELLEDYHAKLTRPQDKQLRLAIERVIRIFKSRLFQALLVPQTREWFFVSSVFPLMLITLGYLYFVLYAGPRYMKNRPPYNLRNFVLIYDIIQILVNAWFVKEHFTAGWSAVLAKYQFICGKRTILDLNAIRLIDIVWWLIFLKLFDYVETCIFVLRKKQNQVSTLHVYHHVSNVVFLWYYLKYVLDERATFISMFNCAVHVIMYIYYFIAAWKPNLQPMLSPFKRFLTKLQMGQFVLMIIFLLQTANPKCETPRGTSVLPFFIGNLFVFLYLFYDFYKKNYTPTQKKTN